MTFKHKSDPTLTSYVCEPVPHPNISFYQYQIECNHGNMGMAGAIRNEEAFFDRNSYMYNSIYNHFWLAITYLEA